jgi:hypothetical protein
VRVLQALALAAAIGFAAFVGAKGIPTLRHDWNWPIERTAIPTFVSESTDGWLSVGFGIPNAHPTTYLIALPIAAIMWLLGPLAALALVTAIIGYLCMRSTAHACARWGEGWSATIGLGLFALFNPWVYNEVVAGHLVMILAYGGLIGLFAEMLRGAEASPVRLALWIALIEAQLQFYLVAMLALLGFAVVAKRWLPVVAGLFVGLPSLIGIAAERTTLLRTPYGVTWQTNQSVGPGPLLALGGYFPGYADRLGLAASISVWIVLALGIVGAIFAYRSRVANAAFAAAAFIYVVVLGIHGPFAAPYVWIVRNVPESGVFRELYDLAGVFAALVVLLACAAALRYRVLGYAALAAGIALPVCWILNPPSDLWIGSTTYPHPTVAAPPFTRIAFLPAFQPLGLRSDGGDGADPDAYVYPIHLSALNEYFPTYPVDMALARYEQSGDFEALRALGVAQIVARPWMVSRARGGIGLAAISLAPKPRRAAVAPIRSLIDPAPLISQCPTTRVVALVDRLGACDVFFADAPGFTPIQPVIAPTDSIDPQTAWIDARLAFGEMPAIAQALGGALTQSNIPYSVEPSSWLLAYVRGALRASNGLLLAQSRGAFVWLHLPNSTTSVRCVGLCELIAQASSVPRLSVAQPPPHAQELGFRELRPWLYVVGPRTDSASLDSAELVRLNERYDPAWIAIAAGHILPHVRAGLCANGWLVRAAPGRLILLQVTALVQCIAELLSVLCVLWLLKALVRAPTKRARCR